MSTEQRYLEVVKRDFEITMTSLQVAEITGKNHSHVIRDIEDEIRKLGAEIGKTIFGLTSYTDKSNRQSKMYNLSKDGAMQLGTRYDATTRYKLIQRMNELEKQLSTQFKVPTTMKEALLLALEQQEQIEKLEAKQLEDKPKVEFYNEVTESKDTIDMATVAKVLNVKGIGRNKLFEILRDKKVLMQNNQPYQKYIDNGWFRQIETKWTKNNGDTGINIKTVVLQKGVDGIRKIVGEEQ